MDCLKDHCPLGHSPSCEATSRKYPPQQLNMFPNHQSALLKQLKYSLWTLFLCFAFMNSAALPAPKPNLLSSSNWKHPLDSVLALNSSVHYTEDELHHILAPLTSDFEDEEHIWFMEKNGRTKREVTGCKLKFKGLSTRKQKNKRGIRTGHRCENRATQECGRIFINAYEFAEMSHKRSELLATQCTLRTAFFDCLKEKSHCRESRNATNVETKLKSQSTKGKRFKDCLAWTIWDSRLCIYRSNIQLEDESDRVEEI